MRKFHGIMRDGLRVEQLRIERLIAGHLGREHAADLSGDALAIGVDRLTGEILVFRHLREDGGNFLCHAARYFIHLLVLQLLRLLWGLRQWAVRLNFLGDSFGELVNLLGVDFGKFLIRHQGIGLALGDRVLQELVNRFNVPAGLFGGGLQLSIRLRAQSVDFSLLLSGKFTDSFLIEPES